MLNPDRLVEKAGKIKESIVSSLDPLMNRHTMLTSAGIVGFVGLGLTRQMLYETSLIQPNQLTTLITTLPFAYPIFKGAVGNLREHLSPRRALSLAQSRQEVFHMALAGYGGLHFAGEYAQSLAYLLGGADFGQAFYGHDLNKFFLDPHMIPYWSLNIPAAYLMGKAGVSAVRIGVGNAIRQIQMIHSQVKAKPDNLEHK